MYAENLNWNDNIFTNIIYFKVIHNLVFTYHKQTESLEIYVYAPYLGEFRFGWSKLKSIKKKRYLLDIIYKVIPLHIYNMYRSYDLFEEQLRKTSSAITVDICLIKDWNKNIIGASITASNWEIISKNIS